MIILFDLFFSLAVKESTIASIDRKIIKARGQNTNDIVFKDGTSWTLLIFYFDLFSSFFLLILTEVKFGMRIWN